MNPLGAILHDAEIPLEISRGYDCRQNATNSDTWFHFEEEWKKEGERESDRG